MTEPPTSSPDLAAPRERDELLATKVAIPRTRPDRLARARLFQPLDEGMARALVLVCAPAGFDKTTLAGRLGRRRELPGCLVVAGPR
jgi:ATP/maltotriose-dependent transcriptional regulator MalT